jgi:hypothetical protein
MRIRAAFRRSVISTNWDIALAGWPLLERETPCVVAKDQNVSARLRDFLSQKTDIDRSAAPPPARSIPYRGTWALQNEPFRYVARLQLTRVYASEKCS